MFRSAEDVEAAISELTSAGWDRSELSLLAQPGAFETTPGIGNAAAATDPGTARAPVVSDPDVRQGRTLATSLAGVIAAFVASGATIFTGGTALAAVIGAAAAGGGAAAAINAIGQKAGSSRADFLHEQVERGGILLWVMLRTPDKERVAHEILARHGAQIVEPHPA